MREHSDLLKHLFRVVHIARCVGMKRALTNIDPNPSLNFWRLSHSVQLDMAVLEWCKVFGSNAESTHWKNIVPEVEHDSFRNGLLSRVAISPEGWAEYWCDMKTYRDRQVAHYEELPTDATYPTLDLALKSASYYYEYLIDRLRKIGETKYPDSLDQYADAFLNQAQEIGSAAYSATGRFREKVF